MAKQIADTIMWPDLHKHPAVKAWMDLRQMPAEPDEVQVVKYHRKSWVFRIKDIGPGRSAVIAKRCEQCVALKERTIYEEILPHSRVSSYPGREHD